MALGQFLTAINMPNYFQSDDRSKFFLILLLQAAFLVLFIVFRLMDADEGIYLNAANLVTEGLLPYHDFFSNQMPYISYLYAPISGFGMNSLYAGRVISVLLSLIMSLVLYLTVRRISDNSIYALITVFLFGLNGLTLTWQSTIKTSVVSDFFGFLGFVLFLQFLTGDSRKKNSLLIFGAGFLIGLAFNFRLTHLIFLPVLLGVMFYLCEFGIKLKIKYGLYFLLGSIIASTGAIILFFIEPYTFFFDNLIFRQVWGANVVESNLIGKLFTYAKFALYPQNLPLIILSLFGVGMIWRKRDRFSFSALDRSALAAFSIALALTLLYLYVTPTQFQYYGQTLPYLILASIPGFEMAAKKLKNRKIAIAASLVYLLSIAPFIWIFIFAPRAQDAGFKLSNISNAVEVIKQETTTDEKILSFYPHFGIYADREQELGFEVWGINTLAQLSEADRKITNLIGGEELLELINSKKFRLVVSESGRFREADDALKRNYRLIGSFGAIKIYKSSH